MCSGEQKAAARSLGTSRGESLLMGLAIKNGMSYTRSQMIRRTRRHAAQRDQTKVTQLLYSCAGTANVVLVRKL